MRNVLLCKGGIRVPVDVIFFPQLSWLEYVIGRSENVGGASRKPWDEVDSSDDVGGAHKSDGLFGIERQKMQMIQFNYYPCSILFNV